MSAHIEINLEECTSCMTCVNACFVDVLRWNDSADKPTVVYEPDCVWCFTCEINCPAECIDIKPHLPEQTVSPY